MEDKRTIEEIYTLSVTTAGETVKDTFTLNNRFANVTDLAIGSNRLDLVFFRGKLRFVVDNTELLPDDYPASMLVSAIHQSPNDRFKKINIKSVESNNQVDIAYTDDSTGQGVFVPYTVQIIIKGDRKG